MASPWVALVGLGGATVGYGVSEAVQAVRRRRRRTRRSKSIEQLNAQLHAMGIASELDVLTAGPFLKREEPQEVPTGSEISETRDVVVRLGKSRPASPWLRGIIERNRERWLAAGYYDGQVAGVTAIQFPRSPDEEVPSVVLDTRPVGYFEFLGTNANLKLRHDLSPSDQSYLQGRQENPLEPVYEFANPLSVEVLLICDRRQKFVLQRRSGKTSLRQGTLFPSVAENVSIKQDSTASGELDVLNTVRRGMREELGVDPTLVDRVYATALCFDHEIWDYKFTFVAFTELDESSIRTGFQAGLAKDRYESAELLFFDFPLKDFRSSFSREPWGPEAGMAYIRAIAEEYSWKKALSTVGAAPTSIATSK
jgi:hypothetical protein